MIEPEYKSTEEAIKDLTKLLRPLGRLTILEPSNLALATNIFKNLKLSGISATKEEIEQISTRYGWDTKQASKLADKFCTKVLEK
ncbi:MAG: hypothetical protein JJE09_12870 [Bacteroidia bacterium]|nr:hypothetical protein [Bacteroidia bacterium]